MPDPESEPEPEPDEGEETSEPVDPPCEGEGPYIHPPPPPLSARRQAQQRKAAVKTYTRAEVQAFMTQAYDQGYEACMGVAELCKIAYEDLDESPMLGMMKEGLDADEARTRIQLSRAKASEQTAIRTMQLPDDGIETQPKAQRGVSNDMVKAAYANYNNSLFKVR
jgi:hypothetical protein